jgi:hypothetical protein
MDSPPPSQSKSAFGTLSPERERNDLEMGPPLSPESEDESGEHAFYSTEPENEFCMNAPFS